VGTRGSGVGSGAEAEATSWVGAAVKGASVGAGVEGISVGAAVRGASVGPSVEANVGTGVSVGGVLNSMVGITISFGGGLVPMAMGATSTIVFMETPSARYSLP
jgi:hypothetical protein